MNDYIYIGSLFIVGFLLITIYFKFKKNAEDNNKEELQINVLNALSIQTYECFQYFLNIKVMVENKIANIKEFLDNQTIENAQEAFSAFGNPIYAYNVNLAEISFTVKKEPMISDLILKLIRCINDTSGDLQHFNNEFKRFNNVPLNSPESLEILKMHYNATLPQLVQKTNLTIYTAYKLLETINSYREFFRNSQDLIKYYDVDDVPQYINEITTEINEYLKQTYWQRDFKRCKFKNISKFEILNCIFKIKCSLHKFKNNASYILAPTAKAFDLIALEDFAPLALESMLMFKNPAYMHNFHFKEDLSKEGFCIRTINGTAKIILGKEFEPTLYRGQNKDYGNLTPSYLRIDKTKNPVEHCVQYVKREEFKRAFSRTSYFTFLSKLKIMGYHLEIDLDAIAQHYEFPTNYLDVTKDIRVALFFAYTQYVNGKYYPIDNFKNAEFKPVLYVTNFAQLLFDNPILTTVGFQGISRPQKQFAMALKMSDNQKDAFQHFYKIELPADPLISRAIYNSFNKGESLFAQDPINDIRTTILDSKLLCEDLFLQYCEKYNIEKESLIVELSKNGFTIKNWDIPIDVKMETDIIQNIHKNLIPWIKKNISYRKVCRPKSNNEGIKIDLYPLNF